MAGLETENSVRLVFEGLYENDVTGKTTNQPIIQGLKTWKSDSYISCLWNTSRISILESLSLMEPLCMESSSSQIKSLCKHELSLGGSIVDVFYLFEKQLFALDRKGFVYSLNSTSTHANDLIDHMEVEDIFDSSPPSKPTTKWKEKCLTKIDCETLIASCLVSNNVAALVCKDGCVMVLIFGDLEFKLRRVMNLEHFYSQIDQSILEESVISSCLITTLSPSLKELFRENLNAMDRDIIVVGLPSGLVLWFSPNSPDSGPHILCSSHAQIQAIHWIPDGDQLAYLAIVMCSGKVIMFGNRQQKMLSLPDNVVTSCSFDKGIVTSNRVDCYTCHIQSHSELTLDCVLMPIKGVCALTRVPDSHLMLAATVHNSLYRFNPSVVPSEKSSQFVIPPQTILDTMLTQTQHLEGVYKQMALEDEMLKAISTASVVKSLPSLFEVKIQVLSDDEFSILIRTSELRLSSELWMVCVDVVGSGGRSETVLRRLTQDLVKNSELVVTVQHRLCVGDIVRAEMLCSMQPQSPILTVPLPEVFIDPSYLLISKNTSNKPTSKESLKEILCNLNNETKNTKSYDCRVSLKVPDEFDINSLFPTILQHCKHRIPDQELNKLEGGKKSTTKLRLHNESVFLNLDPNSREFNVDCSSAELSHQLKEFVFKQINSTHDKHVGEDLVLDIQGLYQQFEIEVMKDQPDIELLESYKNKLRSSISKLLPV